MDIGLIYNYVKSIGGSKSIAFVGANSGDEIPSIKRFTEKIYAFEPVPFPSVLEPLFRHADSNCEIFNVALSDREEMSFIYPASNNFQSTSLLKPSKHLTEYPVGFFDPIPINCKRFDSYKFSSICDFLILDVQGAELKVLNGISDYSNIKLIYSEYTSNAELYENQCSFKQLNNKLENEGFHFCETTDCYRNPDTKTVHGNAIWRKL